MLVLINCTGAKYSILNFLVSMIIGKGNRKKTAEFMIFDFNYCSKSNQLHNPTPDLSQRRVHQSRQDRHTDPPCHPPRSGARTVAVLRVVSLEA